MFHAMFVLVSPGLDGCTIYFMIYVCIDTDHDMDMFHGMFVH